jgi:exonuclease VII small subunit
MQTKVMTNRRTASMNVHRLLQGLLVWVIVGVTGFPQEPIELEHAWETDPPLNVQWASETPVRMPALHLEDFDSAVLAKRFEAARTALELSSKRMDNSAVVLEKILSALERGESNLRTRQMLVSAAAAMLDDRNASRLWPFAEKDTESRACIEQALIRVKSPIGLTHWRSVIESNLASPSDLARAFDGLAVCGQQTDLKLLRAYLRKQRGVGPLMVRAANALGKLSTDGQQDLAKELIESKYEQRFYLAALVLAQHQGDAAAEVLQSIVKEGNGVAKQSAFETLCKIDREKARELATDLVSDTESGVRQTIVAFLESFEDRPSFLLLARRLADEIPSIRRQVRKELLRRSQEPEFRKLVDKIISQAIAAPQFEAAEQAVILIVELKDMSRENDLLKLLEHPKPEVSIRASWALSILARDKGTLEAMRVHVQSWTDQVMSPTSPIQRLETDEQRISFLLEAFGSRQFQDAESLLRLYIPKADGVKRLPSRTRLSAIWAIGKLYANRQDADLRKQLEDRVNDMAPVIPELLEIRFVSAIALGRMRDKEATATLTKYIGQPGSTLHEACNWALQELAQQ